MALRKIITNVSPNPLQILNIELAPADSFELPYSQWAKAADSDAIREDILAGLITLNDGTQNLNTSDAFALLLQFQTSSENVRNFSYNNIMEEIVIPVNQQMIVKRRIKITDRLIIRGQLCLI